MIEIRPAESRFLCWNWVFEQLKEKMEQFDKKK